MGGLGGKSRCPSSAQGSDPFTELDYSLNEENTASRGHSPSQESTYPATWFWIFFGLRQAVCPSLRLS